MVENLPAMQETWVQCRRHPGSGRSPGEGNGNPLEYSCLKNAMDRGSWQATVHGITKSWTKLSVTWAKLTLSLFTVMCVIYIYHHTVGILL